MAALLLAIPGAASAGEIYRWVDENGVVHFGDHPPEGVEVKAIPVRPNPVQSVSDQAPANPQDPPEEGAPTASDALTGEAELPELSFVEKRRKERADRRQQSAEDARKRAADCATMLRQKEWLEPSPRVLVREEDGSVTRLDDDARERGLREANEFLQANCR